MFETVYYILTTLTETEKSILETSGGFAFPGWFEYFTAIFSLLLCIGFNLMLYLFLAFGIRHIYRKKGLKENCFIWIPILQFYALIKTFGEGKFLGMKKSTFTTVALIVFFAYYILFAVIDIYYFAGDICYFIFHGTVTSLNPDIQINSVLETVYGLMDLLYYFALCGVAIFFFKERSPNYFIFTLLCIFVPDLFPIFVFAFRKRDLINFGQYKVVYTNQNYGRYENMQGQSSTGYSKQEEEPFGDFSDNPKTDYSEPFADFSNSANSKGQIEGRVEQSDINNTQSSTNSDLNTNNDSNTNNEDDLFN